MVMPMEFKRLLRYVLATDALKADYAMLDGSTQFTGGISSSVGILQSQVADSSSAEGWQIRSKSLTSSGAAIVSFENSTTWKLKIDKDGKLVATTANANATTATAVATVAAAIVATIGGTDYYIPCYKTVS